MNTKLLPLIFALTTGLLFTTAGGAGAQLLQPGYVDEFVGKPRVVVLSDMGNEPDDQMSFEGATARAVATATAACRPNWAPANRPCSSGVAHIILAVTDSGSPSLTSYRRVILNVSATRNSAQ